MKKRSALTAVLIVVCLLMSSTIGYYFLQHTPVSGRHGLIPTYSTDRFLFPENWTANETILESLRASGDYLVGKIDMGSGRWVYEYDPVNDRVPSAYNILRHAGTTYSLALIFKYTRDLRYYNGTIITLNHILNERLVFESVGGIEIGYVKYGGQAKLGGVALAVLALAEVLGMDPEPNYARELDAMGNFLLAMQHPDGKFQCFYGDKEDEHNDYYPGEALLALAKLHYLTGEERYLDALVLGLGFYTGYYRDTGYTAFTPWGTEAMLYAHGWTGNASYLSMCYGMAESCLRGQHTPDTAPDPLFIGGWGASPAANGASRIEGVIDSYMLAKRTNDTARQERYLQRSVLCGQFLMALQLNRTGCNGFPRPEEALGGTPLSFTDSTIRIDYVQHAVVVLVKIMVYTHSVQHI